MELNNPIEAVEGENITLRWDYSLIGGTVDRVQWLDMKNTEAIGKLTSNGPVMYSDYTTRFKIDANDADDLQCYKKRHREYTCVRSGFTTKHQQCDTAPSVLCKARFNFS